jgi:uncharacterized protein (TIGR04255 family)
VSLTPESLTLSTSRYSRWEIFSGQLDGPLAALRKLYNPSFLSRIGLKYSDFIERNRLGLRETPWSKLLRPEVLGELLNPVFEEGLEDARRVLRVRLPSGSGSVLMTHGLGMNQETKEVGYLIDFDFFTEQRTEVSDAESKLSSFHDQAGRAFRWCITEQLHRALEPSPLDG